MTTQRGCTQCGECLNACPVFRQLNREEYSPKAKRLLLEGLAAYPAQKRTLSWEQVRELARMCTGCERCSRVCARGLSASDLLAEVRAANPHWSQYLWELWIRRMGTLWPAIGFAASMIPEGLLPKSIDAAMAPAKALLDKHPIEPWLEISPSDRPPATCSCSEWKPDRTQPVLIFAGCTASRVRPGWTEKAGRLLKKFGYTVIESTGFNCCGATMQHAGQFEATRRMREQNIGEWDKRGRPQIVSFCASCYHGLAGYAEGAHSCLSGEQARAWKGGLFPLSALLPGAQAKIIKQPPKAVGYHQPCHWGDNDPDLPLLSGLISGLKKGTELCCGMGGILKMSNPSLSMDIAASCLKGFPPETDVIITGCSGCALQLASAAPKGPAVGHWLDVIR